MARSSLGPKGHSTTIRKIERHQPEMIAAAMEKMHKTDWFEALSPESQGWVEGVVTVGVARFVAWLKDPTEPMQAASTPLESAPSAAAWAISLRQTVELIRIAVEAIEPVVGDMAGAGDEDWLMQNVFYFGREVGFAAAVVYARVAEQQGARTERERTDLVEAALADRPQAVIDPLASRLHFDSQSVVRTAVGLPSSDPQAMLLDVERVARRLHRNVLAIVHDGRVLVIWCVRSREHPSTLALQLFPHGRVIIGPQAASIAIAGRSLRAAISTATVLPARPAESRIIEADELLPERALFGEVLAREVLVERCYLALNAAGKGLLETVDSMIENRGIMEQAAKSMPVHVNTLRYRLDRIAEVSGFDLRDARGSFAIWVGVSLGRMTRSAE